MTKLHKLQIAYIKYNLRKEREQPYLADEPTNQ